MRDSDFKERAEQHWEYVKGILKLHDVPDKFVEIIGWNYKTALIHGYKHGKEDMVEEMEKRFGKQATHGK